MGQEHNDKISALADGELGRFEARRWTDELLRDSDYQHTIGRYHLIGDVMRRELSGKTLNRGFTTRVVERLEQVAIEPVHSTRWAKPLSGFGIAASVALVSIFGLKTLTTPSPETTSVDSLVAEAQVIAREMPGATQVSLDDRNPAVRPASRNTSRNVTRIDGFSDNPPVRQLTTIPPFMENYIATHAQYSDPSSMVSHVRLVGYELDARR